MSGAVPGVEADSQQGNPYRKQGSSHRAWLGLYSQHETPHYVVEQKLGLSRWLSSLAICSRLKTIAL
jgi:hypothetical protein